jgi:cytochrome c-type biogenesis protein CcmH
MIRLLCVLLTIASPVWAVQPDEILTDVMLEARARDISKDLRCLVCRNENIDSSNAGIAKDLRILVRERLVQGDSNEQVIDYVVDRYGEFVLLKPKFSMKNMVPWLAGPVLLLLGLILAGKIISKPKPIQVAKLTDEEEQRLNDLMGK